MKLKFVDAEILCSPFRFDKPLPVNGVLLLKSLFVDLFNRIFTEAGDLSHLLVCVGSNRQQIAGILVKGFCDHVAWRFETDELLLDCPALIALELYMRKSQATQFLAKAKMPKRYVRMAVNMHPFPTFTQTFAFW